MPSLCNGKRVEQNGLPPHKECALTHSPLPMAWSTMELCRLHLCTSDCGRAAAEEEEEPEEVGGMAEEKIL